MKHIFSLFFISVSLISLTLTRALYAPQASYKYNFKNAYKKYVDLPLSQKTQDAADELWKTYADLQSQENRAYTDKAGIYHRQIVDPGWQEDAQELMKTLAEDDEFVAITLCPPKARYEVIDKLKADNEDLKAKLADLTKKSGSKGGIGASICDDRCEKKTEGEKTACKIECKAGVKASKSMTCALVYPDKKEAPTKESCRNARDKCKSQNDPDECSKYQQYLEKTHP